MKPRGPLTKADTRALRYAVDTMSLFVRVMSNDADFTPEQVKQDQQKLRAARAALRKVNAIRSTGQQAVEA